MIDAGVTTAASRGRRRCFALIKLGNGQRLIMQPCNCRTPVNNSRSQQDNQILLCSLSTVETLLPRRCGGLDRGWMDSLSKGHPRSCGDDSQPTPDTRHTTRHTQQPHPIHRIPSTARGTCGGTGEFEARSRAKQACHAWAVAVSE